MAYSKQELMQAIGGIFDCYYDFAAQTLERDDYNA